MRSIDWRIAVLLAMFGVMGCAAPADLKAADEKDEISVQADRVREKFINWMSAKTNPTDDEILLIAKVAGEDPKGWRKVIKFLQKKNKDKDSDDWDSIQVISANLGVFPKAKDAKDQKIIEPASKVMMSSDLTPITVLLGSKDNKSTGGQVVVIALVGTGDKPPKILMFATVPK